MNGLGPYATFPIYRVRSSVRLDSRACLESGLHIGRLADISRGLADEFALNFTLGDIGSRDWFQYESIFG
jgi:hypothetical protein